ncbi:MAG: 16S rRNA (adenine(1518)-N(6)/adenine(1519)-N(6))-dimethyltransferase RsmA [Candidatus Paceibacterota bacterium]|jgi:16S rRNA (adenine1518-N6/adenine1519-N6)-dimethyltransferase
MSSNLSTIQQTKELLKKYGIEPQKKLGQNFLVDKSAVKKLVEAGGFEKTDLVIEIGPGIGVLTKELALSAGKMIAVEKDRQMVGILSEELATLDIKNVEITNRDILAFLESGQMDGLEYKAAGNIPFYLTSHLIRILLESKNPPKDMIFIMQKEVAQRIAGNPPDMTMLSASVQFYARPKIMGYIKRGAFWPVPAVDAAIIKITPKPVDASIDRDLFFKILRGGFSQPRKQLINNLSKSLKADRIKISDWLLENDIQPSRRAETLSMGEWIKLASNLPLKNII